MPSVVCVFCTVCADVYRPIYVVNMCIRHGSFLCECPPGTVSRSFVNPVWEQTQSSSPLSLWPIGAWGNRGGYSGKYIFSVLLLDWTSLSTEIMLCGCACGMLKARFHTHSSPHRKSLMTPTFWHFSCKSTLWTYPGIFYKRFLFICFGCYPFLASSFDPSFIGARLDVAGKILN